jgi:hypothetical protein
MTYLNKLTNLTSVLCLLSTQAICQEHTPNQNSHNSVIEFNHNQKQDCDLSYKDFSNRTTSVFVQGAYTYWAPYQEGMDILLAPGTATTKGNVITPKTYFSSGFKVGAGANNTESGWFWAINYTWFKNNPSFKKHPLPSTLNYISPLASNSDRFTSLQSKFSNQFNRIDGFFDRDFYSGKKFTLRPWVGFLGSWEKQNLSMDGRSTQDDINQPHILNYSQNWWGVGPYSGMNCMYNFTQNFGLYIAPGASILYARHKCDTEQYSPAEGDAVYHQATNYAKSFYNMEPMLEISLGVNLSYMHDNFGLALIAAWEIQTYFSHNGLAGYYSSTGVMGNYTMQGLTAGIRLTF